MSKTIQRLKDGIKYHRDILEQFEKVYKLVQENPQMEMALSRLLEALEKNNFI